MIGATTFWFFNAFNKSYDARITYPIEFVFEADSVLVMKPLPTDVQVDVSGGGWNLLRRTSWFFVEPITIALDNPTEIGYYTRASLTPIVTDQLAELRINYVVTDTMFIHIEEKKQKQVKLVLDSLGIPLEENHRITSQLTIAPDSITLIGPSSFIDTLRTAYPLGLPLRSISSTFDRNVRVGTPNDMLIRVQPEEVRVHFEVDRFDRFHLRVPVETRNFPDSTITLNEPVVEVFYTLARSKKEDYKISDFAVMADWQMRNKKDSTIMAILVYYPEHALDVEIIPSTVKAVHVR